MTVGLREARYDPIQDRGKPEADRDRQRELTVGASDLDDTRGFVDAVREAADQEMERDASVLVFGLLAIMPGDPAVILLGPQNATPEAIAAWLEKRSPVFKGR